MAQAECAKPVPIPQWRQEKLARASQSRSAYCAHGDLERRRSGAERVAADQLARVRKRVFEIDIEQRNCGGALKIIAAIKNPPVIVKVLSHLSLLTHVPPLRRRVESIYSI